MKNEIWRSVNGYEGLYEVSNLGRVRSLDFIDTVGNQRKGRILKSFKSRDYPYVSLYKCGTKKNISVHILVAKAFVENPFEYNEVLHMDENRDNPRADNLMWGTHKQNTNMPLYKERQSIAHKGLLIGDKNPSFGKTQPDYLKYQWSCSHKGNKSKSAKVICDGMIFDSVKACAIYYQVIPNTMNQWLSGRNKMPERFINLGLSYVKN